MQGNGDLVEVALPVNAGGVNEFLVVGDALGGLRALWAKAWTGLRLK